MDWHVVTTETCNLHCTYCLNNDFRQNSKRSWEIPDFQQLVDNAQTKGQVDSRANVDKNLISNKYHLEDNCVLFYGGEPLLNMELMQQMMDDVKGIDHWTVTTNGTLLEMIPEIVLNRLDTILVSIDGRPETTNKMRGENTYQRALTGAKSLRKRGWSGDLVARMTVSQHSLIEEEIAHILQLTDDKDEALFDHVHWQLNALWNPLPWDNFTDWVDEEYNIGVSNLFELFMGELRNGKIIGIAPFTGLITHLLDYEVTSLPAGLHCRSGLDAVAVFPNGDLTSCPTAPDLFSLGTIKNPIDNLQNAYVGMEGNCANCSALVHCGGRCLVANRFLQEENDFSTVCTTIKHLIKCAQSNLPEIKKLIAEGVIEFPEIGARPLDEDGNLDLYTLRYPMFNNSIEVIP